MTENELSDPKRPEKNDLHCGDVRGDVLRPPHGTASAAVKIKNSEWLGPLEVRTASKK